MPRTIPTAPPARAIIGLIIQRSTIELFNAYGVAVAPADDAGARSSRPPRDRLIGSVQLTSETRRGILSLSCSDVTLGRMKPGIDGVFGLQDWMREVTNQLAGRIKNRFGRYRVMVQVGLPSASVVGFGDAPVDGQRDTLVFLFRTLTDDVKVTLGGGFDGANFDLKGGPSPAEEGDIILF